MKIRATIKLILSIFLLSQNIAQAEDLSYQELNNTPIIGRIGIPIGTVATVEAVVVSGDDLGNKGNAGKYLLQISKVNGKALNDPIILNFFMSHATGVELANDSFSLYKLKTGKNADRLSSEQIKILEESYVGQSVILLVYETGGFNGIPNDLPREYPIRQGTSFQFQLYLEVLAQQTKP